MKYFLNSTFSLPLGLFVAFGRMSKNIVIRNIIKFYISIMRGTPLILQLMVVYFGPYYLLGISLPRNYRFTASIIGFALNYAAYFAEIYRGGIESMSIGQYEATKLLGYSKSSDFYENNLAAIIKRILPAVTNEVITLIKDTSLAFAISVPEMFSEAKAIASAQTTMLPYIVAGVYYYIFNYVVAFTTEVIENKLSYYQ